MPVSDTINGRRFEDFFPSLLQAFIELTVSDANDNPPEFLRPFIKPAPVPESVPPGHVIAQFDAKDKDTGVNARFKSVERRSRGGRTDRPTSRQTDKQTDRQTDRQADRQTDETER